MADIAGAVREGADAAEVIGVVGVDLRDCAGAVVREDLHLQRFVDALAVRVAADGRGGAE